MDLGARTSYIHSYRALVAQVEEREASTSGIIAHSRSECWKSESKTWLEEQNLRDAGRVRKRPSTPMQLGVLSKNCTMVHHLRYKSYQMATVFWQPSSTVYSGVYPSRSCAFLLEKPYDREAT